MKSTNSKYFKHADTILITLLIIGAILCICPPPYTIFFKWVHYQMQITLAYWILGFALLFRKSTKPAIAAFCCCAILCIYLKSKTNTNLQSATKNVNQPIFKIAHFNLNSGEAGISGIFSTILKTDADVVSLQEMSPTWSKLLKDSISKVYPHQCLMEGSGLYGIAILSKYPFVNCDTLYIAGIPNIVVCLKSRAPETKIYIVDSYITPPLFTSAYETMQKQLAGISQYVSNLKYPVITLGDYNMEGTSSVIQDFREKAHLNDSRRGFRPVRNDGHISLFEVPMDHIFYSNHLNCIDFQTISGTAYERMGILGTYQINPDSLFNVATIHK